MKSELQALIGAPATKKRKTEKWIQYRAHARGTVSIFLSEYISASSRRCSSARAVYLFLATAVNEAEYGARRQKLRDGGIGRILIGALILKPLTRLAVLVEEDRRVVADGAVDCGAARPRAEDSFCFGLEEGIDHVV